MHPVDVKEYLRESVDELKARLETLPDLHVVQVDLEDFDLYVATEVRRWGSIQVTETSRLLIGGAPLQRHLNIPDLGRMSSEQGFLLHLDCTNFDGDPPAAQLLSPDRSPLPAAKWPHDPTGRGIVHGDPYWGRPFFCRPGLREYHRHPQHEDDAWDRHREGASLAGIAIGLLSDLTSRWILE